MQKITFGEWLPDQPGVTSLFAAGAGAPGIVIIEEFY